MMFKTDNLSLAVGLVCVGAVFAVEACLFWMDKSRLGPYPAFATILPAALFIAPYSWNYDQTLLTIPIIFLLVHIAREYGTGKTVVFTFGIVALAFGLVAVAYAVGHDVWSSLNSFLIWVFSMYFAIKSARLET